MMTDAADAAALEQPSSGGGVAKMAAKKSRAVEAETPAPVKIVAYKGFDKDLKCRGFQYEIGKTYEHTGQVVACKSGFHACTDPWDVLKYYVLLDGNRFATVTARGEVSRENDGDSKIATASLTVGAELKMPQFIGVLVNWIIDATKGKGDNPSGDYAQIGASGNGAKIGASGDYAQIGASGNGAQIGASGDYAQIGASGYGAQIGASGDYAQIGASGNGAQIKSEGKNGVIASAGVATVAQGAVGTWISLAEFDGGVCIGFATGCIGQEGLLPGVDYIARGGKLVAA